MDAAKVTDLAPPPSFYPDPLPQTCCLHYHWVSYNFSAVSHEIPQIEQKVPDNRKLPMHAQYRAY